MDDSQTEIRHFRLRILVLLVSSGICSSVERALLASSQQRQSPANQPLFGLTNFAADGVKLFAKVLASFSFSSSLSAVFLVVFSLFAICLLIDIA